MNTILSLIPFQQHDSMRRMMDRMFDDTWNNLWPNFAGDTLAVDMFEDGQGYTIITALPGVQADNIQVKVEGEVLSIYGEIKTHDAKSTSHRVFNRSIRLPQRVNTDKAEASYKNGLLTLRLPISETSRSRNIPVKSGGVLLLPQNPLSGGKRWLENLKQRASRLLKAS